MRGRPPRRKIPSSIPPYKGFIKRNVRRIMDIIEIRYKSGSFFGIYPSLALHLIVEDCINLFRRKKR